MKFSLFNNKPIHLYDELKPKERTDKLFLEFVFPYLENQGYKYVKSKREFIKKDDFFDCRLYWTGRKFNQGNEYVKFDIFLIVNSPNYRKWESQYYKIEKLKGYPIDGNRVEYIENWNKNFYDSGWYDLVKYDNRKLMETILENIKTAGESFFYNYNSFDKAIKKLSEHPIANFEKIIDFYLIQGKAKEASDFFERNKKWFEEEENKVEESQDWHYKANRKIPYILRREKIKTGHNIKG